MLRCHVFALIIAVSSAIPSLRAAAQANEPDEVDSLIEQLSAEQSLDRQQAFRRLVEIGQDAIEPLAESIQDGESAKRMRSMATLQRIAQSEDVDVAGAASKAITLLSDSDDRLISIFARQAASRVNANVKQKAINDLLSAGAEFLNAETEENIRYLAKYQIRIGNRWTGSMEDLDALLWLQETSDLALIGEHIDDAVIERISRLPQLSGLRIRDAKITCRAFELLAQLDSLAVLDLVYCEIGDECVDAIRQMNLRAFNPYGTNLTPSAIQQLSQSTNMRIDYRQGGFLGVIYDPVGPELRLTFVVPDSAADRAGLKIGDVITRYENKPISGPQDFIGTVSNNAPGDRIAIQYTRGDETRTTEAILGQFTEQQ